MEAEPVDLLIEDARFILSQDQHRTLLQGVSEQSRSDDHSETGWNRVSRCELQFPGTDRRERRPSGSEWDEAMGG